jgi:transcriptional regulator with XRE-family HTH domain
MQDKEDAFQNAASYIIEKNKRKPIKEINFSFIGRCVSWMKSSEFNDKFHKQTMSFEDIAGTSDDKIDVNEIFGKIDMQLELVDVNTDLNSKIGEMATRDKRVIDIARMSLDGFGLKEISKRIGLSMTAISRILNGTSKVGRKKTRSKIDRTNLKKFLDYMKQYGEIRKIYVRLGDLFFHKNGRIFSSKPYFFNTYKLPNKYYVAYIDEITFLELKGVVDRIEKDLSN